MDGDIVEVDLFLLDSLIRGLQERERKLQTNVVQIFGDINNLEAGWSGDSYDRFKELMNTYKDPLNSAAICVGAFAELLKNDIAPAAEMFQSKVMAGIGYSTGLVGGSGKVQIMKE